jgi:hypothetical protein
MKDFFDEITDQTESLNYLDQGSEAWEAIRVGRFTSSEFHKLMGTAYREMTDTELKARPKTGKGSKTSKIADHSKISETAETYIKQKVFEARAGKPKPQQYAYALGYGKEHEPDAVEEFERLTGLVCVPSGFHVYTDHAGGSPDRLIGNDAGLEVKCPVFEKQIDYEMLTDHYDLKRMFPEYYWQCVTLLLFLNRKTWYFASWSASLPEGKRMRKRNIIELSSDNQDIKDDFDLINVKLAGAVKSKLELIKLLD